MPGYIDSWRIQVNEIDQSQTVSPSAGNRGATVINAPKGPLEPLLIPRGNSKLITDVFGEATATYHQIWEAVEANKSAEIWLSAPSLNAKYGGVLVTQDGSVPFISGQLQQTLNFAAIEWEEIVGTGDGVITNFIFTTSDFDNYNNTSIEVLVNDVALTNYAVSDAEPEIITADELSSGSYTRATGALDITFLAAPADGDIITIKYTTNYSTSAYYALFNKNPEADSKAVLVTMDSSTKWFTINHKVKNSDGTYTDTSRSPYLVSLVENEKGDDGANIYILEVLKDDYFMFPVINTTLTVSTFTDDVAEVDFAGGDRGDAITASELADGWEYFKQANTYQADIFFDCTADPAIPTIFDDLRNFNQKYSAYILPLPNESYTDAIATKNGYSISNRGVYYYWNWAKVNNTSNNATITTNLIGRVFQRHAAMVDVFNGLAPSWKNENNHGGQLGGSILSMYYDPDEDALQELDKQRINPITFDSATGYAIRSQRTSLLLNSDYSYINHSRTGDYLISNIITLVLPQHITKLNSPSRRALVKSLTEQVITPLLAEPYTLLRDSLVVCDETNNTDEVLAARQLIVSVYVKYTPTSETIVLNFVNVGQSVELQ